MGLLTCPAKKERLLKDGYKHLTDIARQIKKDDNPVLYRYHFKRSLLN